MGILNKPHLTIRVEREVAHGVQIHHSRYTVLELMMFPMFEALSFTKYGIVCCIDAMQNPQERGISHTTIAPFVKNGIHYPTSKNGLKIPKMDIERAIIWIKTYSSKAIEYIRLKLVALSRKKSIRYFTLHYEKKENSLWVSIKRKEKMYILRI